MPYTVNDIAKLAGVTPRTLRYYDKVGLLTPSYRTEAGYRQYNEQDLATLQQILFFRELDFPLQKIIDILLNPSFDRAAALTLQHKFLEERAERYLTLAALAANTLANMKGDNTMSQQELFKGFDYEAMQAQQAQYADEVNARWGDTDAYKVSKQRTAKMTKEDWAKFQQQQTDGLQALIACYQDNVAPSEARMQAVVEAARTLIDTNFYPCSPEFMRNLGQMYVDDPRFTAYYDNHVAGLAAYYNEAIQHYADVHAQ